MQQLIVSKLPEMVRLFKKHEIESASLFGSVVTSYFSDTSDIDLVVDIKKNQDPVEAGEHLWNLQADLEKLLDRRVDLLTMSSLRNPVFIAEINETKQLIYGN
ncbi:MAG: hypothetical protein RLZZ312_667 [Bacteroidota bacterium]|jgi:predicted nucleotidyltransferase